MPGPPGQPEYVMLMLLFVELSWYCCTHFPARSKSAWQAGEAQTELAKWAFAIYYNRCIIQPKSNLSARYAFVIQQEQNNLQSVIANLDLFFQEPTDGPV